MSVRVERLDDVTEDCDSGAQGEAAHPARWQVWTSQDTGDGSRFACDEHLGDWVETMGQRLGENGPCTCDSENPDGCISSSCRTICLCEE